MTSSSKRPYLTGPKRARMARQRRQWATDLSQDAGRPAFEASDNGDNATYDTRPMAFTKGLKHDDYGTLQDDADYIRFEEALTGPGPDCTETEAAFDVPGTKKTGFAGFRTMVEADAGSKSVLKKAEARTWESPLAGLYYVEEGPDPGTIGIPGAPRLGGSELCAEMAEVYAMALVRDMKLDELSDPAQVLYYVDPDGAQQNHMLDEKTFTVGDLLATLNTFNWFDPKGTPFGGTDPSLSASLSRPEHLRRLRGKTMVPQTVRTLFRGSAPGAQDGRYLSVFLRQEHVDYGAQIIDQKITPVAPGLDFMTSWTAWLDVQNGADLRGIAATDPAARRLMETGRDLARYVHIDQLYQAYHIAALLMGGSRMLGNSLGFPENAGSLTRDAFASFGGPHALALFAEVSSRALKAVRRQKYQIHRRARPERLAALLTLAANGQAAHLGNAESAVTSMLEEMKTHFGPFLALVAQHNTRQNGTEWSNARKGLTGIQLDGAHSFEPHPDKNYLLPMAFPEGSPMHPAYGAGHATVAGACVTVLKAFFRTVDPAMDWKRTPITDIESLQDVDANTTVEGELNKLAANISIGRDFAGVHYYSDYYESLRLGERVAVGILHEQMTNYNEPVSMNFHSFDGDRVTISTDGMDDVTLDVSNGTPQWWLRNTGASVPPLTSKWLGV